MLWLSLGGSIDILIGLWNFIHLKILCVKELVITTEFDFYI